MNKKTMLIISLIFSILALLYLISDYYGGNRYIIMHMKEHDNYIKNYGKLKKASKERVIVCFSNTDPNLPNINPFLNSILDQTVRIDEIMLITPYHNIEKIPQKYKKILTVHGHHKNYYNVSNLICSVLTEPEANTKIIIVESSIVYPVDFIETMVSESDRNPDKIIYGSENKDVKYGILIKSKFFDDRISKDTINKSSTCCDYLNKYSNSKSSVVVNPGMFYEILRL
jgi:hypothetical protein